MSCHRHDRHIGYSTNLLFSSYSSNVLVLTFVDAYYLQFKDESLCVVIDKGGLDALMEPKLSLTLGNQYLSEVSVVRQIIKEKVLLLSSEDNSKAVSMIIDK